MNYTQSEIKLLIDTLKEMIELVYKVCKKFQNISKFQDEQHNLVISKAQNEDRFDEKLFLQDKLKEKDELLKKQEIIKIQEIKDLQKEFNKRLEEDKIKREEESKSNCILRFKFDDLMTYTETCNLQKKKLQKKLKALQEELDYFQTPFTSSVQTASFKSSTSKKESAKMSAVNSTNSASHDSANNNSYQPINKKPVVPDSQYTCPKCLQAYNNNQSYLQHCTTCDVI